MAPISVLFLTTSFPSDHSPMNGIFVARLAAALAQHCKVEVLAPRTGLDPIESVWFGLPVHRFVYAPRVWERRLHGPGGLPAAIKRNPLNLLAAPGLLATMAWKCLRHSRAVDLVHAHWAICGAVAVIFSKVPVLLTLRGADVDRAERSIIDRGILGIAVRRCRRVLCVNDDLRNRTSMLFPRHASKMVTVPNGVGEDFFSLPPPESKQPIQIVAVGSLIPRKGFDVLIDALARLREADWRLKIIGAGRDRTLLERKIVEKQLSDRAALPGAIAPERMAECLSGADILVCPSRAEGRPNVVLEAMAAARAVVASDIPGMREIVRHKETGLLFASEDGEDLARQLGKLIEQPELISKLGEAARTFLRSEGLTWEASARNCIRIYQDVLNR